MAAADDINKLNEEITKLSNRLGKGTLKIFEPSEVREAEAAVKGLRAELSEMVGSATSLYEQLKGVTSAIKGQETATTGVRKAFRSLASDATKLKNDEQEIDKLNSSQLKKLLQRVKINKEAIEQGAEDLKRENSFARSLVRIVEDKRRLKRSEDEINELVSHRLAQTESLSTEGKEILASYLDQDNAVKGLLDKTNERLKAEKEIDKKVRGFSALSDLSKSIPGLRKFSEPFAQAEKSARTAAAAQKDNMGILKAGGKGLAKAFGPITLAVSAFQTVLNLAFKVSKQVTEIGKAQAMSATEANNFREQIQETGTRNLDLVSTTSNLLEAQTELSKQAGATRGFKVDELRAQTHLTKLAGIQAESAAKLATLSRLQGKNSKGAVSDIIESTVALQQQSGIQLDNRDVIEEVANIQGQLSANYANSPKQLAQAVVQVRKLGLNLQAARNASSQLLDFESSIGAELEAELLTGKSLNLERARAFALQGKTAEAAEELAKNFGSLEEFQNMNVLQQEAIAKAVGMTADELGNALVSQTNLAKLGDETRKQVKARVEELKAEGRVEEANRLLSKAASEEDAQAALFRVDAQTRFNQALDKAKDIFASIIDSLPLLKGILVGIGVVLAGLAISAIATASALTLGIGAVAIAAGIGTAVAAMRSAKKSEQSVNDGVINPAGGLVVSGPEGSINLNKKDTIVAGTNLFGNNSNQSTSNNNTKILEKLDRLITAVEKGGDVFMDGAKVGRATVLAGTNLS